MIIETVNAVQNIPQIEEKVPDTRYEEHTSTDFSYDGYQVVRGTFFAHLFEPSVTFKNEKVYVNAACIRRLPTVEYVQFLVHPEKKMLAIKPCTEDTQDSFRWCVQSPANKKRKAKAIPCKVFFSKVMELMHWNPAYRYLILGKLICTPTDKLFVFDLSGAEAYERKQAGTTSGSPLYPDAWKNSFGIPANEHDDSFKLEIFNEDGVFKIEKDEDTQ